MASTNKTSLGFSQFLPTDPRLMMADYNTDMAAIDSEIAQAQAGNPTPEQVARWGDTYTKAETDSALSGKVSKATRKPLSGLAPSGITGEGDYLADDNGVVTISGRVISSTSFAHGQTILQMPAGYRIKTNAVIPVTMLVNGAIVDKASQLSIAYDGGMIIYNPPPDGTYVNLVFSYIKA